MYQPDSEKTPADWKRQVERLQAALREYGKHKRGCSRPDGYSCDCGFEDRQIQLS